MPATTKAQFRWLHTPAAMHKLGAEGVREWIDSTSDPSKLPERAPGRKKKRTTTYEKVHSFMRGIFGSRK